MSAKDLGVLSDEPGGDDVAPRLLLIGYWRANSDLTSPYPDPRDWVDPEWDENERDATWFYFSTGTMLRAFMGFSPCRMCGKNNGAVEYTDGTYCLAGRTCALHL